MDDHKPDEKSLEELIRESEELRAKADSLRRELDSLVKKAAKKKADVTRRHQDRREDSN